MKHVLSTATLALILATAFGAMASNGPVSTPGAPIGTLPLQSPIALADPMRLAMMCLGRGEELSGGDKICYYDCLGSVKALTISAGSLCPLSIDD